jgi:hypothetical protein
METKMRVVLGFTGLDFQTSMDACTKGSLSFIIKDHPTNADKHAELLGRLLKSQLVLIIDNGTFSIFPKEPNNANNPES